MRQWRWWHDAAIFILDLDIITHASNCFGGSWCCRGAMLGI